jgi:CelD/BcsL family acetyltransferase involved in cellulose biosynthesis
MNTEGAYSAWSGVHGFRARRFAAPRNDDAGSSAGCTVSSALIGKHAALSRGDLSMSDTLTTTRTPVIESGSIAPLADEPLAGAFDAEPLREQPLELPFPPAAGLVGRATRTGLMLSVHSDLEAIEGEWRAFERTAAATAFQAFDWLHKWQRHIGSRQGTRPAVVLGRNGEGHLLFILPLALERRSLVRQLRWLGHDLCDYNAPLLAESFRAHLDAEGFAPLWHDILALLRSSPRFRFDLIDLQRMPETVAGELNPFTDLNVTLHPSGAHIARLTGNWEAFYASKRSSANRKVERKKLKQMAEHGAIGFADAEDGLDAAHTMDVLMDQKGRALTRMGVDNFLLRPGYREFFLDVGTDAALADFVHVGRMTVGPTIAATSFGLVHRGCYYLMLSSYDDGELARFGPGRAHLHEILRRAIGRGLGYFDFTVGDESYKREWSDVELRLYDHTAAATMRGLPAAAVTTMFRRSKRFIKQTPVLWRAFSKVRGLLGACLDKMRQKSR